VSSYADLAESPAVLDLVRAEMELPPRRGVLADEVTASNPLETLLIDVEVQHSSPRRAQEVAYWIGQVLNTVVAELETTATSDGSPVRISVVRPATVPTKADGLPPIFLAAAGLGLGLLVGLAAAQLAESRGKSRLSTPLHDRREKSGSANTELMTAQWDDAARQPNGAGRSSGPPP
jgi:capsular polysaccharide biosynthesis protein